MQWYLCGELQRSELIADSLENVDSFIILVDYCFGVLVAQRCERKGRFDAGDRHAIDTAIGRIWILNPTQMVMDKLAAYLWWHDRQSWYQALMLARLQHIEWDDLRGWVV